MFGKNPIRKPENGDGSNLYVQEVFATLQGEGPRAGQPAIFIRLGGCNLACHFCDTEFEDFAPFSLAYLHQEVIRLSQNNQGKRTHHLIVLTGGEPLRQNIAPLGRTLLDDGFIVQIETNGTLYRDLPEEIEIVCSPKAPQGQYHPIRADLLPRIKAFKFIISNTFSGYTTLPEVGQSAYKIPVYVQPMDEYDDAKNKDNLSYTAALAQQEGVFLSLQQHKILGLP